MSVHGIDLGTTYCALSKYNETTGLPEMISNPYQVDGLLASAVFFPEDGNEIVVGQSAKEWSVVKSDRVVQFAKRYIGLTDDKKKTWAIDGKEYDPIAISSLILKQIKHYAEEIGETLDKVVITVPAKFDIVRKEATKQAAEIAGLEVLQLINEPTAAALNYTTAATDPAKIMVYDLGGGTFDVTVFDLSFDNDGVPQINVIASEGDDFLGGADWDEELYKLICKKYADAAGVNEADFDDELKQTIHNNVEATKIGLTTLPQKKITITYQGVPVQVTVTRDEFEEVTKVLVDKTMTFVEKVLSNAKLTADKIDKVLLVGGSTFMPMIKNRLDNDFPGNRVFREEPNLAVAKGASIAAYSKFVESKGGSTGGGTTGGGTTGGGTTGGGKSGPSVNEICGNTFGIGILDENNTHKIQNLLFKDSNTLSKTETFYSPADNISTIIVPAFQSVAKDEIITPYFDNDGNEISGVTVDETLAEKYIGKVLIDIPAGSPKGYPIEVTVSVEDTALKVTVKDPKTGNVKDGKFELVGGLLSEKEIKDMSDVLQRNTTGE